MSPMDVIYPCIVAAVLIAWIVCGIKIGVFDRE